MFRIGVKAHFDAAHLIRGYEGKCRYLHGHRWEVEVVIQGEKTDQYGFLVDFSLIKKNLKTLVDKFDHRNIIDIPPFDEVNPSAENLAFVIYEAMKSKLEHLNRPNELDIVEVRVWEAPENWASYSPK